MEANSQLTYALGTGNDLDAIYEMYMDKEANPFLSYDPMGKESFIPVYNDLLRENNLFVARSGDEIVGTYRLIRKTHRQKDTAYLGGFTVKTAHKGKGFGKKILEHIKQEAKSQGVRRIELTVTLDNEPAIHLYKKCGFEIEGLLRCNYTLQATGEYYDEYLMSVLI